MRGRLGRPAWHERFTDKVDCCEEVGEGSPFTLLNIHRIDFDLDGVKELEFFDSPNAPGGVDIEFETWLVGVAPDGSGEIINYVSTCFRWKYDGSPFFDFLDDIAVISNTDPSLSTPGGVSTLLGFIEPGGFTDDELEEFAREGIGINSSQLVLFCPTFTVTAGVEEEVTVTGSAFDDENGTVSGIQVKRGGPPAEVSYTVDSNSEIAVSITAQNKGKLPRTQSLIVSKSDGAKYVCKNSINVVSP